MSHARLSALKLTAFKTFHQQVLPLNPVTILIGRNGAGKSNALDGLEVLSRLAEGDDLADALDGRRREGGAIRGGSAGCPPHGFDSFTLGCDVSELSDDLSEERSYRYTVTIEVIPELRVVAEALHGPVRAVKSGKWVDGPVFETREPGRPGTGLVAEVHNGTPGRNEHVVFRDDRLLLTQIPLAIPGSNQAQRSVLDGVRAVLTALRGSFHLDPVPHLMRAFVPARDDDLKRTGENVSAALNHLAQTDLDAFRKIEELVAQIADDLVSGIEFAHSDLGDVMLTLIERSGPDRTERTPAREMSDGLLRFLAIATALSSANRDLDVDAASATHTAAEPNQETRGGVLIVLEELENGLHSSQARRVLELVRQSAARPDTSVLVTTHSPAMLDAAEGDLNDSVIVCHRDPGSGYSLLTRLTEVPGYTRAVTENSLGDAVTSGKLGGPATVTVSPDYSAFKHLIGLT